MKRNKRIRIRPFMPGIWKEDRRFYSWLPRIITKKMHRHWYGPPCDLDDELSPICSACQGHKLWNELKEPISFRDFLNRVGATMEENIAHYAAQNEEGKNA